ncbi:hypothetical protein V2P39_00875 [Mycoplasma capricolum subsp. capricolum]|uniref:Mbov_0400 family ICE element protein n=1 Tax=Mycoplasma capricolum TaxID=2095 RepID=UPI003DA46771
MSNIQIGKVYKKRYKEFSFPIAKDRKGSLIDQHGYNRPYIIFFSDEKVFYLSAKTITSLNRKATINDKTNIIFKKDLYGKDREIAVNCSVINVMDRELFESLYIKDSSFNNFQTDIEHYNKIMKKLFNVFDEIKYFEVDHINEKTNQPIWKLDNEAIKNKKECEMVIKGYHYLIRDNKISPEIILDKPEHFFEVTKEYFNILKNPSTDEAYDYVWNYKSIDWDDSSNVKKITQQAYDLVQKEQLEKEKQLKEKQAQQQIRKQEEADTNNHNHKFKMK